MDNAELNALSPVVGDISVGRTHLGEFIPLAVSRLFTTAIEDTLTETYGAEAKIEIMRMSGKKAGVRFCVFVLDTTLPPPLFLDQVVEVFKEWRIGDIRIENNSDDFTQITISIAEDMHCSGLPILGETVCNFEEGLLEGIFTCYFGVEYTAREIDCWATGHRVCRFRVSKIDGQ